jgi:hypothetical protein
MFGRPSGFRRNQLDIKRERYPARDLVLRGEEIHALALEPLAHRCALVSASIS